MDVVATNYLPGDQRLVDQIVYELKSQGIFDQFRKECFADVDTKPAYQNLRQRVEGSVTRFLKGQSWRPDMNKNQVREMLRKSIYESGYLETGVERIVDQVVNPKINTVFLPKVEEVVYSLLGIEKPVAEVKKEKTDSNTGEADLLPTDLEAVSPESEPFDKKDESIGNKTANNNVNNNSQETVEDNHSKVEDDESPPFEPLDEQSLHVQEENSIDSHISGFSDLVSHESSQSNEIKGSQIDLIPQDSQMSQNSSESRLSIVTSEDNTKMDICEDSQTKSLKSVDINSDLSNTDKEKSLSSSNDVEKNKSNSKSSDSNHRHRSRSESKSDRDRKSDKERKSSKDSKSHHSSSSRDKHRERKDSKSSSSKNESNNSKDKNGKEKDRNKSTSSSSGSGSNKYGSNSNSSNTSKDKNLKKESSSSKDKSSSRSTSNKDSKTGNSSSISKSSDSKSKDDQKHHKSSSSSNSSSDKSKKDGKYNDRHKSSSSSSNKSSKDKKKETKKDDHYSFKDKKYDRRSTDRDSNDGHSMSKNNNTNNSITQSHSNSSQKASQDSTFSSNNSNNGNGGGDTSNSDKNEVFALNNKMKLMKPKFASNIHEAMKLMKIRKQLAKLEKQNQLSLASVEVDDTMLISSSISLESLQNNGLKITNNLKSVNNNNKGLVEDEVVTKNRVVSQDNWDAMEAKLQKEINNTNYQSDYDDDVENLSSDLDKLDNCKYLDNNNKENDKFFQYVQKFIIALEYEIHKLKGTNNNCMENNKNRTLTLKRKQNDLKNNNVPNKRKKITSTNLTVNGLVDNEIITTNSFSSNGSFTFPLSPADSDLSLDKNELSPVRNNIKQRSKALNNQRYSSDDLYKPRPVISSSRRRGAKNNDMEK